MSETPDQYVFLKVEFKKVDIKNATEVKKWFTTYDYLTVYDHAFIMERCTRYVRELKIFAGLKGKRPTTRTRSSNRKNQGPFELPPEWRTFEWLQENLKRYGVLSVLRASGLCKQRFYEIVRKAGIPPQKGSTSKNPCCTKAWCHRHYVELGYSLNDCAKLAGITHARFADWLVKFMIPIRSTTEQATSKVNLSLGFRILIAKMRRYKIISKIRVMPAHLYVRYRDGKKGRYAFWAIEPEMWRLNHVPKITPVYEVDIIEGQKYPAHIQIDKDELTSSTVFERDIALHTFHKTFTTRGWIWPHFPQNVLEDDLNELKNAPERHMIKKGSFTLLSRSCGHGRKIMLHFFDSTEIYNHYFKHNSRISYKAIKYLASRPIPFNTFNLIRSLTRGVVKSPLKFPSPALYATIFKRLNVTGKVLDLFVGCGARAIACGLNKLEYHAINDPKLDKALEIGLNDFMKSSYVNEDNAKIYDLIICDHDLTVGDLKLALTYANKAKNILAYVPKELKDEYLTLYKPKSILKLITNHINREPNFFFIW